ncbi:MAG: AraC family transcriptional regulator [Spirochaetaceae bacterium]
MLKKIPMLTRIFILITLILSITTIFNTGIVLYFVEKNIVNKVIESEKQNLKRSAYSVELLMKEANNLARHINTNLNIRKILYNTTIHPLDISYGVNALRNFQDLTGKIHSIYIFNSKTDQIYYTGDNLKIKSSFNKEKFFDTLYMLESINGGKVNNLYPHRRILMEYNYISDRLEPTDVYTFLYSYSHHNNYEDSSLIVINISLKWLKDSILFLDQSPQHKLEVLDMDKNPILDEFKNREKYAELYNNLPQEEEFILKDISVENGSKNYVIGLESPFLKKWYFLKFIDIKSVLNETDIIRKTVLIIALSVLLTMVIFTWFSIKTIKRPIDDIIHRSELMVLNEEVDVQTIQQAKLKTLIDFYQDFPKQEVDRILFRCNEKFMSNQDFFLLFLHSKEIENKITLQAAENFFKAEFHAVSFLRTKPGCLTIIIQDSKLHSGSLLTNIKDNYQFAGDIFLEKGNIIYYPNRHSLKDLGESIQVAMDLMPYVKCFDYKGSVDINTLIDQNNNHGIYPLETEKKILKALIGNKTSEMLVSSNNFLDSIKDCNIRFYYRSMNRIIRSIYEQLRNINPLITRHMNLPNLDTLLNSLNSYSSFNEQKEFITAFIEKALIVKSDITDIKDDTQINKIISYIINNYDNSGLGSQMIADYIKLNPTYLQSLFKKETKVSLHEYINNYRLKKSVQLLESTSLPIKDILHQIGYTNEQSFFRLFKKEYNTTPTQFRNRLK